MRVGDGALSAANLSGRVTTVPIAETVCVNGSMRAFAVLAATTGFDVSASSAASLPLQADAASRTAKPPTAM
jgi:hypothetical protein